ncbi:uncharacterized protein EDB93DRAFT_1104846 [Suillus bovinus]|uniref:uncharacterized protein n=1 Tax=Suillus bovinus TaxID=48563 RepID=UPI001B86E95F|nr:uncharacterized protein EDB93DRAFT_1104846 [Suillus bovinus]KAG2144627.1 hypothetical protein EDB93DRAFT_1104846 [Suillus bovinus]
MSQYKVSTNTINSYTLRSNRPAGLDWVEQTSYKQVWDDHPGTVFTFKFTSLDQRIRDEVSHMTHDKAKVDCPASTADFKMKKTDEVKKRNRNCGENEQETKESQGCIGGITVSASAYPSYDLPCVE